MSNNSNSNFYKLQRFVNGTWVDVQLGKELPAVNETSTAQIEEYVTFSQIQDEFVATDIIKGNADLHTLEQNNSFAVGNGSVAFGSSVTRGEQSVSFGGTAKSLNSQLYWNGTNCYLKNLPFGSIIELENSVLKITVKDTDSESKSDYVLIVESVVNNENSQYLLTFSNTQGDWTSFRTIVDSLTDSNELIENITVIAYDHIAIGQNSLVSGNSCLALEKDSHALGDHLIAAASNQTVVGKYNEKDNQALFVVGSGDGTQRSNILTVFSDTVEVNNPSFVTINYLTSSGSDVDEYTLFIPGYDSLADKFSEAIIYWERSFFNRGLVNHRSNIQHIHLAETSSVILGSSESYAILYTGSDILYLTISSNGTITAKDSNQNAVSFRWTAPVTVPPPHFKIIFTKRR